MRLTESFSVIVLLKLTPVLEAGSDVKWISLFKSEGELRHDVKNSKTFMVMAATQLIFLILSNFKGPSAEVLKSRKIIERKRGKLLKLKDNSVVSY
jgi:hypothetical protein